MPTSAPSPLRLVPPPDRPATDTAWEPEVTSSALPGRPSFRGAIDGFVTRLTASGKSPRTLTAYRRDLEVVAGVLESRFPGVALTDLAPATLDSVLADPAITHTVDGVSRASATLHRLQAALLSFCGWATEAGLVSQSPARFLQLARLSRKPPAFLTEAEKRRLLRELSGRVDSRDRRDRVIVEVFVNTGIRLQELVSLDVDDVDLDAKHLRIRRAKGGGAQVKFIKSGLRSLLRGYLAERRRLGTAECQALFLGRNEGRISARQVEDRVKHWLRKAGIAKDLGPHALRHTFATHLYSATSNILLVQRALGHRSLAATEVYTHLVDGALEDALERL